MEPRRRSTGPRPAPRGRRRARAGRRRARARTRRARRVPDAVRARADAARSGAGAAPAEAQARGARRTRRGRGGVRAASAPTRGSRARRPSGSASRRGAAPEGLTPSELRVARLAADGLRTPRSQRRCSSPGRRSRRRSRASTGSSRSPRVGSSTGPCARPSTFRRELTVSASRPPAPTVGGSGDGTCELHRRVLLARRQRSRPRRARPPRRSRRRRSSHRRRVRYLGSILLREDEVVLCQFDGTAETVRAVAERAQVPFERILHAARSPWTQSTRICLGDPSFVVGGPATNATWTGKSSIRSGSGRPCRSRSTRTASFANERVEGAPSSGTCRRGRSHRARAGRGGASCWRPESRPAIAS